MTPSDAVSQLIDAYNDNTIRLMSREDMEDEIPYDEDDSGPWCSLHEWQFVGRDVYGEGFTVEKAISNAMKRLYDRLNPIEPTYSVWIGATYMPGVRASELLKMGIAIPK